ncbi:MAG: hypothetical protein ACI4W2_04665, partial [Eubacterium sp.]
QFELAIYVANKDFNIFLINTTRINLRILKLFLKIKPFGKIIAPPENPHETDILQIDNSE